MVVEAKVARTGLAILQALQDVAPGEAETFAEEHGSALRRAAASLDVSEAEEVLTRWWGVAYLRLNPPTDEERDLIRGLDAGEDVGWASPQDWLVANRR